MTLALLAGSALTSFITTYLFLPWLIRSLRGTSAVGIDINKPHRPRIPEMGGLGVLVGFYCGVSLLTMLGGEVVSSSVYYASLAAISGAGVVGMMDDIFGLRKRTKAILPFLLALPLGAAIYATGDTDLLGVNIGIFMVFAVALGVTSASNAANMLEGFNGLGAGLSIIISLAMILLSSIKGAMEGLFLLFPLLGALVAFLWFNRFPARVFPGDSMTLFAGATLACAAIISSPPLKTWGAILFAPMILEFALKARGHFQGENYGKITTDGRLEWNGRIESLAHAVMRWKRLREWQVVAVLWILEGIVCATVVAVAWMGP